MNNLELLELMQKANQLNILINEFLMTDHEKLIELLDNPNMQLSCHVQELIEKELEWA